MTSLTAREIRKLFPVSDQEIEDYIKRKKLRLPSGQKAINTFKARLRKKLRNSKIKKAPGTDVSFTYSAEAWQIIYGKMRVPGLYSFINSETTRPATITIASPAQITSYAHNRAEGERVKFSTTGALPTGITAGTSYFVRNPTTNRFNISLTATGALINTSGTQSGTHYITVGVNTNLDMVLTLAGHQITGVDDLFLDNERVLFGATPDARWSTQIYNQERNEYKTADHRVFMAVNDGTPANPAIADLIARTPKWTTDHKQSNRAHAFVILVSDIVLFPSGIPEITFEVRGKPVRNIITGVTDYSNNAARVIADYLMDSTFGLGYSLSDLETAPGVPGSFYDAQQVCDELLTKADGSTEPRYTINAVFNGEETPQNILEKMVTAIGGTVTYVNGKWKCFPAKWRTPALLLDENDCIEELEVECKISRRDSFNGIRGTFTSPAKGYEEDDFPPYKNDYYQSLDNGERVWEDISFPCTTSPTTCQRLAKILVEQVRQQIQVTGVFSLRAYQAEVGENLFLVNDRMGWVDPRENLLLWSEDFTKSIWQRFRVVSMVPYLSDVGPFGSTRPIYLTNEETTTGLHAVAQDFAAVSGTIYALKWIVKQGPGRPWCRVYCENTFTPAVSIQVNLTDGTIASPSGAITYSVKSLGNGWWEIDARAVASSTGTALISIHNATAFNGLGYLGETGKGLLLAAMQARNAAICDIYQPTTSYIIPAEGPGKAFEIQELEPLISDDESGSQRLAIRMSLRETAQGVFDWNNGEETSYDLSGNTNLPDPFDTPELENLELFSGTNELYITQDGTVVSRIRATWDPASDGVVTGGGSIELQFKPSTSATWSTAVSLPGNTSFYYLLDVQDGAQYDVRVRARSGLGNYSGYTTVTGHTVIGKTAPPSNVLSLGSNVLPYGIVLGWAAIPDLDADYYRIKVGASSDSWAAMALLANVNGTTYEVNLRPAGTYKFAIKAVDTSGNESTTEAFTLLTVGLPSTPSLTATIEGAAIRLSWSVSTGPFQILDYIIKYGVDFATGTQVASTQSTTYEEIVAWGGSRSYFVAARDVAGNIGAAASVGISIVSPSAPQNLGAQVVDNNVLLRWEAPATGSLPIDHYKVFKGATFSGASQIGQVNATFSAIIELVGGSFIYWVQPFDTGGNAGAETFVAAEVNQPPDYILRAITNLDATNETSSTDILQEGAFFYGSTDTTQTWDSHFTSNSWTTINDQISAGLPYFLQPASSGSLIEWDDIDFGAVLPPTIVTMTSDILEIGGDTTFQFILKHSTDGTTYTTVLGTSLSGEYSKRWLVPAFRYLRLTLTAVPFTGDDAIYQITNTELRLDVKQRADSGGPFTAPLNDLATTATVTMTIASPCVVTWTGHGMVEGQQVEFSTTGALPTGLTAGTIYFCRYINANTFNLSTEPQGNLINTSGTQSGTHTGLRRGYATFFNQTFIDIEGLTVTPTPTEAQRSGAALPLTPVVSFKDAPYNTNFNVEIYDRTGARIACDFRWQCRGV